MIFDYTDIVDKLLAMDPDPIPRYVLLKEFKNYDEDRAEYQNLCAQVLSHPFVKKLEETQNERGFWRPFHGRTEENIRRLLSYGLDINHVCLKKVHGYLVRALDGEESWDQSEKHDNVRWWPEVFAPLVNAATLSLIDKTDAHLNVHGRRWAGFAETAFANGSYDDKADGAAQNDFFGFTAKRVIPPFGYYNLLLLSPGSGGGRLSEKTDRALVGHCMNEADCVYYVYNNRPGDMIPIDTDRKDSRDFSHWIRALSLISRFAGWDEYERRYFDWIMDQRNPDGLWEFPKKINITLSNSWRGKNKTIDSTISVLRLLTKKNAF